MKDNKQSKDVNRAIGLDTKMDKTNSELPKSVKEELDELKGRVDDLEKKTEMSLNEARYAIDKVYELRSGMYGLAPTRNVDAFEDK